MSELSTTYVKILDKEYQVSCPEGEQAALAHAATELDQRMRAIRASGTIVGLERIAVMAALNLCHELQKNRVGEQEAEALHRMVKKLDEALDES